MKQSRKQSKKQKLSEKPTKPKAALSEKLTWKKGDLHKVAPNPAAEMASIADRLRSPRPGTFRLAIVDTFGNAPFGDPGFIDFNSLKQAIAEAERRTNPEKFVRCYVYNHRSECVWPTD